MTDLRATLHEVATDFVRREYADVDADTRSELSPMTRDGWGRIAETGWPALLVPEAHGGHGLDLSHLATVTAAFARSGISTPLTVTAAEVPALLLVAGDGERKPHWMSRICDEGAMFTSALWELPAAYDVDNITAEARRVGDGYELTGRKLPVAHALQADGFVVAARLQRSGELALFVVERDVPGTSTTPLETTNDDGTGVLSLEGAWIPEHSRLVASSAEHAIEHAIDVGAVMASVELATSAQRALELTVSYVVEREQFGQPIGAFQAVHHHCADMYRDVEAMRVICGRNLGHRLGDPLPTREVSILKAKTSVTAREVIERAHQLHGGIGFYADYPLERLYRRSLVAQGAYGSSRWHRARLIELLRTDTDHLRRNHRAV